MKFYTTSKISENIHETPEGFLVCIGVAIARTGEMVYGEDETPLEAGDDGTVLINREAEEVFRPETIASFEGKAVTITHPTEFVDPSNWSRLAKGVLQNVRRGEGEQKNDLIADLLITDSVAINLVKNGLREVSCGYEAEYTQTGEGRGLQTGIIGNHLALVEQGRAGSSYAINDHKGKGLMKLKDRIKAIFAKAQDEAMALAGDAEEKEPKVKDEEPKKEEPKKEEKSKDASAYDELVKIVKDLGEKISAMAAKPKDESSEAAKEEPKKEEAKKEDAKDDEASLEDRLKALETAVSKLLEAESEEGSMDADEDDDSDEGEMSGDNYGEEKEAKDEESEESTLTGDTASRVEILAPGMKITKNVKARALTAAYGTADGKKIIDALTGGKMPTYDSAEKVDQLFLAASEVLKVSRTADFANTKKIRATDSSGTEAKNGPKTAEMINEINAKHYGNR